MSKTVDETHKVAKIILEQLVEKPRRWTELEKLTTKSSPTYGRFQTTLKWLQQNGYINKAGRGVYEITEKGKKFSALLSS
jgi:predicted transcriptional regulator